jgi:asparaginyl-tRNA synthetase
MASISRLRSKLVSAAHTFFDNETFYYVNPPIITRSDAEGAGEAFRVTGGGDDFFGLGEKVPRLTVSSQLHLEALMMGLGKVWTLSPTFRAEKSMTSRHLAEFWMLEAEWMVNDLDGLLSFVEKFVRTLVENVKGSGIIEELMTAMKGQDNTIPLPKISQRWEEMSAKPWRRMTYYDAIAEVIKQHDVHCFDIPPVIGAPLQSSHEQFLASQSSTPIFITNYPIAIKPFYMLPSRSFPSAVENFDLLVPGMGEIAGGSLRVHELDELVRRIRMNEMDEGELEWYKDLRRWGSVPHGGFGLGFDRLIGYLAGVTNLREVVAFPRIFGKSGCLN